MNSNVMAGSYATTNSMMYGAHYITLASDEVSYENPTGKFVMEYATPNLGSSAFDNKLPKSGTGNVVNDDNLGTTRITMSNYIEVTVPKYFFYITDIPISPNTTGCGKGGLGGCSPQNNIIRQKYYKGQKFVAINAGGSVDTPCIIGLVV